MDEDLADARKTFSSLTVAFRKRSELNRWARSCQIPRKGVILLLGSIRLIPSTVFMKPSSYQGSYTFARKHNTNSSDGFYETVVLS